MSPDLKRDENGVWWWWGQRLATIEDLAAEVLWLRNELRVAGERIQALEKLTNAPAPMISPSGQRGQ